MRKLHSIYEYFSDYSKEKIDEAIEKLTEAEKQILYLRYGKDLENPKSEAISMDDKNKFYGTIIPRLKALLGNPNYKRKNKNQKINKTTPSKKEVQKQETTQTILKPVEQTQELTEQPKKEKLEKNDYTKILKLLKTPSFAQMTTILSVKEAIIIALKLGYVDEKYFTTESIAKFLDIPKEEVRETIKKVLELYKDNINNFIDEIITSSNDENKLKIK